ncbi:PREDICTED: CD44 antigen isoform X7 [Ficedula albicollis]|uniref:CD44 antigen isoform X7 n=1 Tax=Ficedula albicollis TaxID=59894 RepID=UPI0007AD7F92|nr:PREDICTED: CD44 antigen isoform X7 [Ficedula albicollis]
MATFSLWAAFGLCLLKLCLTETEFNVSCRYGGVFHVEKNGRYSLTRSEAVELCRALNSTLATLEQLKKAHELGFETCRYGFVVGHIVIPRINPYHLCAANNTGIYKLSANTTARYDAYCYNETETADKTCEPVVKIDTSLLSNQDETVIDNADGSRYNADGTRHTGGESSTSGGDEENAGSGSTHETTAMDASIRRSSPSYYGSPTPVSQLPDHTSGGGEKGMPGKDYDDEFPSVSPDISLGTVAGDFHEDDGQYPASPIIESVDDAEQGKATKEPLAPGTAPGGEGEPANTTDGFHGYGMPGVFSDIEDRFVPLQDPLTTSSSVYGDQGPHKGHYESTTIPGETATTKIASQPRSAPVPDWLIIVVALVVLALILAVCIAVNARRRCGQKQKLVINNGKGAVEDRKTSELNGDISKSQEMVHLVHKEQSNDRTEACDEFLTVNETQNHHEFDMKTGV